MQETIDIQFWRRSQWTSSQWPESWGKLIQQDERYKRIDAAKKANDEDEKLQELIAKFNLKRSELSVEMSQENKNPEKLNQLDKELKALYQEVMANPNMAEFNAAKAEVDRHDELHQHHPLRFGQR